MKRTPPRAAVVAALALFLFACPQAIRVLPGVDGGLLDGGGQSSDAGADSGNERTDGAITDGGGDAGLDGGEDAGLAEDGGEDAGFDAGAGVDGGLHWAPLCPTLPSVRFDAVAVRADGSLLLGGSDGVLYAPVFGASSCSGYQQVTTAPGPIHAVLVAQNGNLYVGAQGGVVVCDPSCGTYAPSATDDVFGVCESADGIEAVGDDTSSDQGLVFLQQNGTTWTQLEQTPLNKNRACFASPSRAVVFGAADGGLWRDSAASSPSADTMAVNAAGVTYTAIGGGPGAAQPLAAIASDGRLVEWDGAQWTRTFDLGAAAGEGRAVVVLDGGEAIAATERALAFRSGGGSSFELGTPPPIRLRAMASWAGDVFAAGDDGAGNGQLYHLQQ